MLAVWASISSPSNVVWRPVKQCSMFQSFHPSHPSDAVSLGRQYLGTGLVIRVNKKVKVGRQIVKVVSASPHPIIWSDLISSGSIYKGVSDNPTPVGNCGPTSTDKNSSGSEPGYPSLHAIINRSMCWSWLIQEALLLGRAKTFSRG